MRQGHRFWIGVLVAATLAVTLALLAAGGPGALAQAGGIIYVDGEAVGRDDGETWRNAYTDLQDALEQAEAGDEIWVAAGTYKPTRRVIDDDPRSATFQMVNGVAIYGGFDPDDGVTKFEERDWVMYQTILSGDIGAEASPLDNVYHVFYNTEDVGLDASAVLDGFVITGGNADQEDPSGLRGCGGGMVNEVSAPTLRNITFKNNSAERGAGIWVGQGFPELGRLTLTNVTFVDNWATVGGAAFIDGTEAIPGETGDIVFTNCIFRGNVAERGGAVAVALGEPAAVCPEFRFIFCTLSGNQAESGGAFHVSKGPGEGWLAVTNSIVWGDGPDEIYVEDGAGLPIVTYSDVQGGYDGEGNIDLDPRYVEPDSGDLHLQADSHCIDAGYNDAPDIPMVDFDGQPRILDGDGDGNAVVDMGVYEYNPSPLYVEIDITPNTPSNIIKLSSPATVPVAILSDEDLDAPEEVIPETVVFAGAPIADLAVHDVDDDGDLDLLVYFYPAEMVELTLNSKEATLSAVTNHKTDIEGTDRVRVKE